MVNRSDEIPLGDDPLHSVGQKSGELHLDPGDRQPGAMHPGLDAAQLKALDSLHAKLPPDVRNNPAIMQELSHIEKTVGAGYFDQLKNTTKNWRHLPAEKQEQLSKALTAFTAEVNGMKNGTDCSWSKTFPDSKTPSLEFDVTYDRKTPVLTGNKSELGRYFDPAPGDVSTTVTRFLRFNTTPTTLGDVFNAPVLTENAPHAYVEYGTLEAMGAKNFTPYEIYRDVSARFRQGLQKLQEPTS